MPVPAVKQGPSPLMRRLPNACVLLVSYSSMTPQYLSPIILPLMPALTSQWDQGASRQVYTRLMHDIIARLIIIGNFVYSVSQYLWRYEIDDSVWTRAHLLLHVYMRMYKRGGHGRCENVENVL